MSGIIYAATNRAPLVTSTSPVHVVGDVYSLDVKCPAYVEAIDAPKTSHVSLAGGVETVLKRVNKTMSATLTWPAVEHEFIEEFLYSIAAGETFDFDVYGTILVPVNVQRVVCLNKGFSISRLSHGSLPWRSVSLSLRLAV